MYPLKPIVSIGLPVYNGEKFLKQSLEALLAQTYEDFELLISDNDSTDCTEAICRQYAAQDQRIRYYRNPENLGGAENYNRVVGLARGKYFKWAACDDICAPDFLFKCVEILAQDDSIVLAHTRSQLIGEKNEFIGYYQANLRTDSPHPQERFHDLICLKNRCHQVSALIRTDVLKQTSLIGKYTGADKAMLAQLALRGRFYEVPEYLFLHRVHKSNSGALYANPRSRTVWFDPKKVGKIVLPNWRLGFEYFLSIKGANLTWQQRRDCYLYLGKWFKQNWQILKGEFLIALKQKLGLFPIETITIVVN